MLASFKKCVNLPENNRPSKVNRIETPTMIEVVNLTHLGKRGDMNLKVTLAASAPIATRERPRTPDMTAITTSC